MADCSDEGKGRHHQRSSTSDLIVPCRRGIIFEEEEWIQVEDYRVVEVEVGIIPFAAQSAITHVALLELIGMPARTELLDVTALAR